MTGSCVRVSASQSTQNATDRKQKGRTAASQPASQSVSQPANLSVSQSVCHSLCHVLGLGASASIYEQALPKSVQHFHSLRSRSHATEGQIGVLCSKKSDAAAKFG